MKIKKLKNLIKNKNSFLNINYLYILDIKKSILNIIKKLKTNNFNFFIS